MCKVLFEGVIPFFNPFLFDDCVKIEVIRGDITRLNAEAIVDPANSYMTMGGGLSGIIRRLGGEEIKREAQQHVPVPVGKAIVTKAGKLPSKFVIHAPTMERPAEKITPENTRLAMKAVLECAEKKRIKEIAVPGLGTGVGGVSYQDAPRAMVEAIRNHKSRVIEKIILVGFDESLYEAFKEAVEYWNK